MEEIGLYDAKTHWSEIINRVGKGESFTITKHGYPVAQLTPVRPASSEAVKQAFKELDNLREKNSLGGLRIRDLIDEGRR